MKAVRAWPDLLLPPRNLSDLKSKHGTTLFGPKPIVEIHTSICTKLAVLVGGCFAFLAVLLSIFLEFQHLTSYTNTSEQNWMVAVIFMVHVYASESIISLSNPKTSLACDILRTCYEAFALYAFGSYLVACLGETPFMACVIDHSVPFHSIKWCHCLYLNVPGSLQEFKLRF
ncbi:protein LAZ1 homolog 2-like isoform X1 [Euphorbia lathyris]|uniref:protein LAZ1 homolog 2-like isoform X1 n=1 Tax=Euphorbia lathyris TaxID=212925 RepID=UPI003313CBEF